MVDGCIFDGQTIKPRLFLLHRK